MLKDPLETDEGGMWLYLGARCCWKAIIGASPLAVIEIPVSMIISLEKAQLWEVLSSAIPRRHSSH